MKESQYYDLSRRERVSTGNLSDEREVISSTYIYDVRMFLIMSDHHYSCLATIRTHSRRKRISTRIVSDGRKSVLG